MKPIKHFYPEGLLRDQIPRPRGAIMKQFTFPPFSILNTCDDWWQRRKRRWLRLGIKSELGRLETSASPGGQPRPATDYSKSGARGDGSGKAIAGSQKRAYNDHEWMQQKLGKVQAYQDPAVRKKQKKAFAIGTKEEWDNERKRKARQLCPGGGTGQNSAWKFRTENGYETGDDAQAAGTGTSIFDPVLTELAYRWFCPTGGTILDPFAGGSVRGIVASCLGYKYVGIELRPEQLESNQQQAQTILDGTNMPQWVEGDSLRIRRLVPDCQADFLFSCPPYGHLEIYSDDPRDLSQMAPDTFLDAYRKIVLRSCRLLRENRFACFVVGDYRLKDGFYANFIGETIDAFEAAGLRFYNSAVLVTARGSLPIRIAKQFRGSRKLGRTHQDMLVFCKGDWRKAARVCEKGIKHENSE